MISLKEIKQLGDEAPAGVGEEMLAIDDLGVQFRRGTLRTDAVRGISLTLRAGRVLGVAGESGSGKTASALAAMGLLPEGTAVSGSIRYRGTELLGMKEKRLRRYRGRHIAMIFQETSTALNPVLRVGQQLTMASEAHFKAGKDEIRERVHSALSDVRLTDTERVMRSYPHELSGGMAQRVVIAMALSCGARVLLADEPTTALDVSVQEEILELIRGLVAKRQIATMLISHDLAVLGELCDDLVVMYQGEVVERGSTASVLRAPSHPYTKALLACLPRLHGEKVLLPEISQREGVHASQAGCRFRARCAWGIDRCAEHPDLETVVGEGDRMARCWRSAEVMSARDQPEPATIDGGRHA